MSSPRFQPCCRLAQLCGAALLVLPGSGAPLAAIAAGAPAADRARLLDLLVATHLPPAGLVGEARAAQAQAQASGDVALQSLALSVECRGLYRQAEMAGADRACADARRLAVGGDDLAMFAVERSTSALILERGRPLDALPGALEAHAAAGRSGNALAIAAALGTLGSVAQFAGANADAVDYYGRALDITARIGADGLRAQLANNVGVLLLETGDADGARAQFEDSIAAAARIPGGHPAMAARRGLALADVEAGRAADAARRLRSLIAERNPQETPSQRAEAQLYLARAEFRLGHHREAETAARAAIDGLQALQPVRAFPAQALLVDVLVAMGKLDEAAGLGERLLREIPPEARGRVEMLEARARLFAARSRFQEAYLAAMDAQRARQLQSTARSSRALAFIRARAQAQARSGELATLRAGQAGARREAQQARTVRNLTLALLAVTLAGALALWWAARARRRLEAEVERRRSLDALGKLTGGVAHDFNNLMTIVQQAMGLLRRDAAVTASGQALGLIDEVDAAARQGGQITRQLLTFAGQQPMRPENLALRAYLDERRLLFERALGATMSLRYEIEDGDCGVRVDPGPLTNALVNLLANAREAMDGKGEVTIRVQATRNGERDRRWPSLAPGRYVAIAVIDAGRGMTEDVLGKATTPFFTTKATEGGSGLGLSTVHGFVRQCGGLLELDSTPGAGTRATLVLPYVNLQAGGGAAGIER